PVEALLHPGADRPTGRRRRPAARRDEPRLAARRAGPAGVRGDGHPAPRPRRAQRRRAVARAARRRRPDATDPWAGPPGVAVPAGAQHVSVPARAVRPARPRRAGPVRPARRHRVVRPSAGAPRGSIAVGAGPDPGRDPLAVSILARKAYCAVCTVTRTT